MRRSTAVTLKDVAREAGVAKMTASVVLNGSRSGTQVSEATRIRIQNTAERLGYRRNAVARGLSRRRMDVVGLVATVSGGGLQEYFLEVFNGIVRAAAQHGQSATVFAISDWQSETLPTYLLGLCDGRVDGLIFLGPHFLDHTLTASVLRHTPIVTVHAANAPDWLCNIDVDNEGGTYDVARYLIELGHRRIAYLLGRLNPSESQQAGARERMGGFCRAIREAGIPLEPSLMPEGDYGEPSGRERAERLLDMKQPPTAFCCANDAVAKGCLSALSARGLRVPEDASVTGFDSLRSTEMFTPPLTTVRQPFFDLGQRAVERLLEQIHESVSAVGDLDDTALAPPHSPGTETLAVELVIRASTGPPPTGAESDKVLQSSI